MSYIDGCIERSKDVGMIDGRETRPTESACSAFEEDPFICWGDGTPKGQCVCGWKEVDHQPNDSHQPEQN